MLIPDVNCQLRLLRSLFPVLSNMYGQKEERDPILPNTEPWAPRIQHQHIYSSHAREQVYLSCFILEQTGTREQTAEQTAAATLTPVSSPIPGLSTALAKPSPSRRRGDAKYFTTHVPNT